MAYYEHQRWEIRSDLEHCDECHSLWGQHIGGGVKHLIARVVQRKTGWAWYVMPMHGHPQGTGGFFRSREAASFKQALQNANREARQRIATARRALAATRDEEVA